MINETISFKSNTSFLITGGAGFIGSNLCIKLVNDGYKVRCLDNLSTGNINNLSSIIHRPNFEFVKGDIRDFETCVKACEGIDFVLHQAAWGSVPRSIEMPLIYEDINVKGTLYMLEASRVNKIKKFVYASSSSVYGDEPNLPKIEGIEGNLLSPYALTKRTNEEYAKLYQKLYSLDTYGLRYFNVFGKHQNPIGNYAAVIPKFITQLLNGDQPIIYGDGNQSRDFTYIENVIEANLLCCLADSKYSGQVFNIAHGGRVSLNDLFNIISVYIGTDIKPIFKEERIGDIQHSNASIEKARQMLNYNPKWSFISGIHETIEWYKRNA